MALPAIVGIAAGVGRAVVGLAKNKAVREAAKRYGKQAAGAAKKVASKAKEAIKRGWKRLKERFSKKKSGSCKKCDDLKERAQEIKKKNGGKNRVETPEKQIDLDDTRNGHYDKSTKTTIETPHVHDAKPPHPPNSGGAGRHPGYEKIPRPATPKDLDDAAKAIDL